MNRYHQDILTVLHNQPKTKVVHDNFANYIGNNITHLGISVPECRKIAKNFVKTHPELTSEDLIELIESLLQGKTHQEKILPGIILGYIPKLRKDISPKNVEHWLNYIIGWCEVDNLCQSTFSVEELLNNWNEWKYVLENLSIDSNINKRRASLVLLTHPVNNSKDPRFYELGIENIEKLKHEKPILITKAISWLLRSMVKNHKNLVTKYIQDNLETLPKIAIRETQKKLLTGKK